MGGAFTWIKSKIIGAVMGAYMIELVVI